MNVSAIALAIAFTIMPPAIASATVPFSRSQLSGDLVDLLINVAHHGVQDAAYVETKLAISPDSHWVNYWIGDISHGVAVSAFNAAAVGDSVIRGIVADGDVLPLRSGKFWNLEFSYVLETANRHLPYPARIEIFNVEEYGCISLRMIQYDFPGQKPEETIVPYLGSYPRFTIDGPDGSQTKLVFNKGTGDEGCLSYIGLWQTG